MSKVKITIDNDPNLNYETDSMISWFLYYFCLPIITRFPNGHKFFVSSCRDANLISDFAKSHKALEILYDFDGKMHFKSGFWNGLWTYIWHHLYNVKAVRNRLKLAQKKIQEIFQTISQDKKKINILTLGAGSARGIINSIKKIKINLSNLKIVAVDKSPMAIEDSKKFAKEHKVDNLISWINDDVKNLDKFIGDYNPNLIEMIGLLDYFTDEEAVEIVKKIYGILPENGYFVTCNVKDNPERNFVTNIVKWPLIYKDEKNLMDIMLNSGFKPSNIEIISEPLKIHLLIVAKK